MSFRPLVFPNIWPHSVVKTDVSLHSKPFLRCRPSDHPDPVTIDKHTSTHIIIYYYIM